MRALQWTLCGVVVLAAATAATAQVPITSGFNLDLPGIPLDVPWAGDRWTFNAGLIFDPSAPPMIKTFDTPRHPTGAPILLDAQQPFPQRVDEVFDLIPGASKPVSDWHEEILTPGWEWMLITAAPLITRNGFAWPYTHIPMPVPDPAKIWVEFPPIMPGEVLDIHKALLWVGTPGNRVWGDGTDDTGLPVDERGIRVLEYPTPEPASAVLLGLAGACAVVRSRRRSA